MVSIRLYATPEAELASATSDAKILWLDEADAMESYVHE